MLKQAIKKLQRIVKNLDTWLNKVISKIESTAHNYPKTCLFVSSLTIVLFALPFVLRWRTGLYGDWDYFLQLYEAFRKSVLEYHQFPWNNPWVAGGVPLFANPQFGLISPQSVLVLVFGTSLGLRLSVVVYLLLGYFGMMQLLKQHTKLFTLRYCLSVIFCTFGFVSWHVSGGHLTFAIFLLLPWLLYFLDSIDKKRLGWLWFGLFLAFYLNLGLHYIAVQAALFSIPFVIYKLCITKHRRKLLILLCAGTFMALVLTAPKAIFTLQYIHNFSRSVASSDAVTNPWQFLDEVNAYTRNEEIDPVLLYGSRYGWAESASYFGVITLALFVILIGKLLIERSKKRVKKQSFEFLLLALSLLALLLCFGPVTDWSPYAILIKLPVFQSMIVPTRWVGCFVFFALLFLAQTFYRIKYKGIVLALLLFSAANVFYAHQWLYYLSRYNSGIVPTESSTKSSTIVQASNFQTIAISKNPLFESTLNNIGEIRGYEPIIGYERDRPTLRCSTSPSCPFVLSGNAEIQYWSPNVIKLRRIASGDIELNMNPGKYWRINGQYPFGNMRVTEVMQKFIITDPSENIEVKYTPALNHIKR